MKIKLHFYHRSIFFSFSFCKNVCMTVSRICLPWVHMETYLLLLKVSLKMVGLALQQVILSLFHSLSVGRFILQAYLSRTCRRSFSFSYYIEFYSLCLCIFWWQCRIPVQTCCIIICDNSLLWRKMAIPVTFFCFTFLFAFVCICFAIS